MKQFDLYFKIIKKNIVQFIIYLGIFIVFTGALTLSRSEKKEEFQIANIKVGVINHDKSGAIAAGLIDYIKESAEYVELDEENESLEDALFFRRAEYILIIPKDFSQDMISGGETKLEKIQIPGSYSAVYLDTVINQYLTTLDLYLKSLGQNMAIDQVLESVGRNLREDVTVETTQSPSETNSNKIINYFFNFSVYSVLSIAILGIGAVISVNREPNLRKRNLVSPIRSFYMDFALLAGSFTLMLLVWAVCILFAIIIYKENIFTARSSIHALNLLVVCVVALSIGFLIGMIFTNNNVRSAAANTVSLGLCFLSGVFVQQEFLSEKINLIASFTPIHWYIKGNNEISSLIEINMRSVKPIMIYMGIQLLFAAAIMSTGLVVSKQKALSRE